MLPIVDDLLWLAMTVYMEAEGETYLGKLAVAFVVMNRARKGRLSVSDVILRDRQFSAWNADSPTRLRLDLLTPTDPVWRDCHKAACAAYYDLADDPSKGASHYLNPAVLPKLPSWWDESKVTATIGRHRFARL